MAVHQRRAHFVLRRSGAHIDDAGDFDAGIQQIERDAIAVAVGGRHHGAVAGLHAIEADQALRSGAEHHAGQVIVVEDERLLVTAARHHQGAGAELVEAVILDQGQPIVAIPAGAHAIGHHPDARFGSDLCG